MFGNHFGYPYCHHLIDNRFGRRVGFLLVPYIILLMVLSSLVYTGDPFFPDAPPTHLALQRSYYDDLRAEDDYVEVPGIASRFIENGYIELFLPYRPKDEDELILAACPGLEAAKTAGLALAGIINLEVNRSGYNNDSLLLCMSSIHQVFVNDSLFVSPKFRFYTHPQRQDNGLLAVLDVQYLGRGEHQLRIDTRQLRQDSLVWEERTFIPFWKE